MDTETLPQILDDLRQLAASPAQAFNTGQPVMEAFFKTMTDIVPQMQKFWEMLPALGAGDVAWSRPTTALDLFQGSGAPPPSDQPFPGIDAFLKRLQSFFAPSADPAMTQPRKAR
jgi:hypothetical protein